MQSLTPLMFQSLLRLMVLLIREPAASMTTLLYYSHLLPHNTIWERLVRREMPDDENYLYHFIIYLLTWFW
ncbi:hypothetical protein SLE2022_160830 [Rubroshorea leprosula]